MCFCKINFSKNIWFTLHCSIQYYAYLPCGAQGSLTQCHFSISVKHILHQSFEFQSIYSLTTFQSLSSRLSLECHFNWFMSHPRDLLQGWSLICNDFVALPILRSLLHSSLWFSTYHEILLYLISLEVLQIWHVGTSHHLWSWYHSSICNCAIYQYSEWYHLSFPSAIGPLRTTSWNHLIFPLHKYPLNGAWSHMSLFHSTQSQHSVELIRSSKRWSHE